MEKLLYELGYSEKEAKLYLLLLEKGSMTATELAELSREKRSNTYMILEGLLAKEVIKADDSTPVRSFVALHPSVLKRQLEDNQDRTRQLLSSLETALPKLSAKYSLAQNRPGVTHMVGEDGFMTLLDDMVRSKTEVRLIASNKIPSDDAVLKNFRQLLLKRKQAGIRTRAIFHRDENSAVQKQLFAQRGIELRFLGETEFDGEVAIYEDNVAFTVYEPTLMVTVITNPSIAETMRTVFEELWAKAKP